MALGHAAFIAKLPHGMLFSHSLRKLDWPRTGRLQADALPVALEDKPTLFHESPCAFAIA
jgi:hypothetical protein